MRKNRRNVPGQRVHLHRALSKLGLGSRTQAWDWITAGEILVDGRVVTDPLTWVDLARVRIARRGQAIPSEPHCTLALHKPRGYVTTRSDERGRPTVYDLLPPGLPYVFPVGRLDVESEGLLIMTSDSQLQVRLTDPDHHVPKRYRVTVAGKPTEETLAQLRSGIDLPDGRTRPATVTFLHRRGATTVLEFVLTEGKNRQIRRMCHAMGHKVRRLVRTAIGQLPLGDLPAGQCRILTPEELALLR